MLKKSNYIIFIFILISCNGKESKQTQEIEENSIYKVKNIESYVPVNIESETEDTIIKKGNFKISITHTYTNTFVIQKSQYRDFTDAKNLKYQTINRTDKIRDQEIQLKITQNSEIILDTVFRKEQFKDYLTKSDLKKAVSILYFFDELSGGKLVFMAGLDNGSLKLHDDVTLLHYYDIKTKTFTIKRLKNG